MLFDTHMHTKFSTDSQMRLEEAVAKARELNLGITVTEHMDLAYPEPQAFLLDIEGYFREYEKYRSDELLLGIEIGMRTDCREDNRQIAAGHAFDYVIGSIHVIDNVDIYCESFYRSRSKEEVYGQYFNAMIDCLETYEFIDCLGHIDYIARYGRYDDPEIYYDQFKDSIDRILGILAGQGKALEINTRRLDNRERIENILPVYRRFHDLGGRLVTVGSDAHKPKDIGKGMKLALQLAGECGLKAVRFKDRKPEYL
ncbi:MAG: histidinol phosphate phosphatase [Veillonellales bacterium]